MVTLEEISIIRAPVERCFDMARSVEVHLKGNVHWGEKAVALEGVTTGLVGMGERVTWRARHFQDTMIHGAFRSMQHDHYFRSLPDGRTEMRDVFRFAAPIPVLGLTEAIRRTCES